VTLGDRYAVALQARPQRMYRVGVGHGESEVEERRRRGRLRRRVQCQVEAVGVADDDRAVRVRLGGGRVEPEVRRVEAQAAAVVVDGQPEMTDVHGWSAYGPAGGAAP